MWLQQNWLEVNVCDMKGLHKNTPDSYNEYCCKVFSNKLFFFSFHSLEKITHSSSGKYECVFLTDPEVKQTIEVKSKLGSEYHR